MKNDGMKSDNMDVWTREQARIEIFSSLEYSLLQSERVAAYVSNPKEAVSFYLQVISYARQILRLHMEIMKEPGKIGKETKQFQDMRDRLIRIEGDIRTQGRSFNDPVERANARQDFAETISDLQDFLDELFHNNTVLGLNYKKKDDPNMAVLKK